MKKILSLIALPFIAVGFCACGDDNSGNNTDDGKSFNFSPVEENGKTVAYTLKDIGGVTDADIIIPSEYKGLPVTGIAKNAFNGCAEIESVTVGANVTVIGDSAFYGCEKLSSAVINGNIISMGETAFADCTALKSLTIGSGVGVIGEYAFLRCQALEKVVVPSSVKRIEEGAFLECTGIAKLELNDGLEYIGDCAFGGCISLSEFIMPSSVTAIGSYGMLMFGADYGFAGSTDSFNQVGKIILSDNLTVIPDFSFSYCGIKTITIGSKVEKICYSSFYGCELLESIVIPRSVKKIESYAFYKCSMLNTVFFTGTAEEWEGITIGKNGNAVSTAEVYYLSETQPTDAGNFWHYDSSGTPVKW